MATNTRQPLRLEHLEPRETPDVSFHPEAVLSAPPPVAGHGADRLAFLGGVPTATLRAAFAGTAPVKSFPPNGYGLYDVAGNVWEWCADWYERDLYRRRAGKDVVVNPKGPGRSSDPSRPFTPQRVQRGGSFLCSDGYCSRYRPGARHSCAPDTGMSHVGFRCVISGKDRGPPH